MLSNEQAKLNTAHYRLPVLILVCLFALCALATAAYGLKGYQAVQSEIEQNHIKRTGLTYIATKLRQADADEVLIPDSQTLILLEEIGGQIYATSIFFEDGMLMESFGSYEPDAAAFKTNITPVNSFSVEFVSNDLVAISLSDGEGHPCETIAYIPERKVAP